MRTSRYKVSPPLSFLFSLVLFSRFRQARVDLSISLSLSLSPHIHIHFSFYFDLSRVWLVKCFIGDGLFSIAVVCVACRQCCCCCCCQLDVFNFFYAFFSFCKCVPMLLFFSQSFWLFSFALFILHVSVFFLLSFFSLMPRDRPQRIWWRRQLYHWFYACLSHFHHVLCERSEK